MAYFEEGFDPYFNTIDRTKIRWTIDEEKKCREKFKYGTMPFETFESYKRAERNDTKQDMHNIITGFYSYNLLNNPLYS